MNLYKLLPIIFGLGAFVSVCVYAKNSSFLDSIINPPSPLLTVSAIAAMIVSLGCVFATYELSKRSASMGGKIFFGIFGVGVTYLLPWAVFYLVFAMLYAFVIGAAYSK